MEVTAHYSNGDSKELESGEYTYDTTPFDNSSAKVNVEIKAAGFTTSVEVTVDMIIKLELSPTGGDPKTQYAAGDQFQAVYINRFFTNSDAPSQVLSSSVMLISASPQLRKLTVYDDKYSVTTVRVPHVATMTNMLGIAGLQPVVIPIAVTDDNPGEAIIVNMTCVVDGMYASGKDGKAVYNVPVSVYDLDKDGTITMMDAFVAMHHFKFADGACGYDEKNDGKAMRFWGIVQPGSTKFVLNGTTVTKSQTHEIIAGDNIIAYVSNNTSNVEAFFEQETMTAVAGDRQAFNVKAMAGFSVVTPAGADIVVYDSEGSKVENLSTTVYEDGNFAIRSPAAGTYTVVAGGKCTYNDGTKAVTAIVHPARCTVNVYSAGYTADEVEELIDKIGTVTKDSKKAIGATREAYDSLTAEQQKQVGNYDKLVAAEKKYAELTGESIETGKLPFTDVKSTNWYYDVIKAVYDRGLMDGESDTWFMPDKKLSRAVLVTILYRMQEEPDISAVLDFDDVAADRWYSKAVAWASANGIVDGISEGRFAPEENITRQEMTVMMYRYAKATGMDTAATASLNGFKDKAQVADWAAEAMEWAVGFGLMDGYEDSTIRPMGAATRAEAAAVIIRLVENTDK